MHGYFLIIGIYQYPVRLIFLIELTLYSINRQLGFFAPWSNIEFDLREREKERERERGREREYDRHIHVVF